MMNKNWMESRYTLSNLVARSAAMQKLVGEAESLVNDDRRLLIFGESGSGKRLLARALHNSGERAARPFAEVTPESLRVESLERTLFGDSLGNRGLLESASEGTICLTNVDQLNPVAQVRLAEVIAEGLYTTGAQERRALDCRIVATADRNALARKINELTFSTELYNELTQAHLSMPALRQRMLDLPHIVGDILTVFSERERVARPAVPYHYMELLLRVEWPENIRQLRNHLESVMALSEGRFEPEILLAHFDEVEAPQTLRGLVREWVSKLAPAPDIASAGARN